MGGYAWARGTTEGYASLGLGWGKWLGVVVRARVRARVRQARARLGLGVGLGPREGLDSHGLVFTYL